jgi:hypothetical protein
MNFRDSLRFVAGAAATYFVMAACGGGGSGQATDGGKPGDSASDGRTIIDALTDPVAEAQASDDSSGTRLKIQRTVGADGSSLVRGLYDSMLKTPCAFHSASDGSVRCLPTGDLAGFSSFFSDSSCKTTLAYTPLPNCSPSYAAKTVSGAACGTDATGPNEAIYPIVKLYTGTVYEGSSGACSKANTMGWNYYTIGAAMPPSDFVAGTTKTDP